MNNKSSNLLRLEGDDKGEKDPNSTTTKIEFKKSALGTSMEH